MPSPPITTWFVGLLRVEQATDDRDEDVDVAWIGDAGGPQQIDGERQVFLGVGVGGWTGFEARNGPLEQELARRRIVGYTLLSSCWKRTTRYTV